MNKPKTFDVSPTLTQDVYRRLKELIVTAQVLPGSPLPEEELSQQLNVSRTPLREALRLLESEGLVEIEPRRGARAARISHEDLADAYEVREWIESAAAAKAAMVIDSELLKKLKNAIDKSNENDQTHEGAVRVAEADIEFHGLIIQAAGNGLVRDVLAQARGILSRAAYFVPPGGYQESRVEHLRIFENIAMGDSEAAALSMRNHIRSAARRRFGLKAQEGQRRQDLRKDNGNHG